MDALAGAPALVGALGDAEATVRAAAATALARITNHVLGGDWSKGAPADRLIWQAEWRTLLAEHAEVDREALVEAGFARAGFAPRGAGIEARVEALLRAAGEAPAPISQNAQRTLADLVGLDLAPMPPAKAKTTWTAIWKETRPAFAGR
jgi:hypothetical protein